LAEPRLQKVAKPWRAATPENLVNEGENEVSRADGILVRWVIDFSQQWKRLISEEQNPTEPVEDVRRRLFQLSPFRKAATERDPTTSPTPQQTVKTAELNPFAPSRLEVRLVQMDADKQKEYQRVPVGQASSEGSSPGFSQVSSRSGKIATRSIREAQRQLNLNKYKYGKQKSATQDKVSKSFRARSTHTKKKDDIRKKSVFAQAFKNHHAQMGLAGSSAVAF
jgi:hypothetical protein